MLLAEQTKNSQQSGGMSRENELWTRYRHNPEDGAALSLLMEHYLPLATQVVHRMSSRFHHRFEPADLLGAAILGLHSAIQRFSENHGVPFAAYARKRMAGAILDELRQRDPLTREQRSRVRRTRQAVEEFTSRHGRPPADGELAGELNMTEGEVAEAMALEYHTVSLSEEAGDGVTYQDLIVDANTPSPLEHAERQSLRQALCRAIPKLDVRDQQLLFFRHSQALSVAEIAAVFEVSPGRVSQMYNSTILRLRALMKL
jgi:RNA polymerase sigma factor for flagellar operon FliA